MLNRALLLSLSISAPTVFAAQALDLYQAPLDSLNHFNQSAIANKTTKARRVVTNENALQQVNKTQEGTEQVVRYQQLYQGVPVAGAQVMVVQNGASSSPAQVSGHVLEDVHLNIQPAFDAKQALELVKTQYFSSHAKQETREEVSELQIRPGKNNELKLVYLVSFKSFGDENQPVWPSFIIDAQTAQITKQWNNIKHYQDSGPGGNEKTQEYWYGKDGLPTLNVGQKADRCVMENAAVKLVDLKNRWDWAGNIKTAYGYPCNQNVEQPINGAFSPGNDAYFFGHTIVSMYREWYGVNALQMANGAPMQLVMRVHFGRNYDNAFWDGKYMSFGDGNDFYPLVSLDVAGHEVTHGFTEQHSNLEYHDQSGALNESISDMAGQASRAYLLETNPQMYSKAYQQANQLTWGNGETIIKDAFGKALRFMDFPSSDGSSADCLDKNLAQSSGAYCAISYAELIAYANAHISNPEERQGYIVHTASGVFNKAFYLMSKTLGVKKAYQMMVIANTKYWTPTTDFINGACGVLYAARDLEVDLNSIKPAMAQVGIDVGVCAV